MAVLDGFARVAALTPRVHLGDPAANAAEIIALAEQAHQLGVDVAVYPELSASGYSLDDLLTQQTLLDQVVVALDRIAEASAKLRPLLIVGAPLRFAGALYNCAVFIQGGAVLGVTPKSHLPGYHEFYEKRYFQTRQLDQLTLCEWRGGLQQPGNASQGGRAPLVPFGQFQVRVRDLPGLQVAAEVCEDIWVPVPPSALAALGGATVLANLSASPVTVGRARERDRLVAAASVTSLAAYAYTAAGSGESSNDLSWDGQALIYESGVQLAQSERFAKHSHLIYGDVDLWRIRHARTVQTSFADNARQVAALLPADGPYLVEIELGAGGASSLAAALDDLRAGEQTPGKLAAGKLARPNPRFPFVPDDPAQLDVDCYESFNIQVSALVRRMESIGQPKLVIGVSGGLDSTQALLVCAEAMDRLGRPHTDILAYTMPGFGTSDQTYNNAVALGEHLGVTFKELDIRPTATAMLETLDHPYSQGEDQFDVTFENVQAGLRTDYLFRLANQLGGIVVGTGDLSELALGWCTYGVGDQMSHYAVNSGLPKTMIKHLIGWVATRPGTAPELTATLQDIIDTEISPELIPAGTSGTIQSTQAKIGPYELQDFTLYHLLSAGHGPRRIFHLARDAWGEKYSDTELLRWLRLFFARFFANQFKRTAIPNGPKILGGGALSPRGDWRMPSDALADAWLAEIDELEAALPRGAA